MTDSRMGEALWPALDRLPRGSGVIVRHYDLPLAERRELFARISRIAGRRGLIVLRAGRDPLGRGEDGTHGRDPRTRAGRRAGVRSWPAHNRRELIAGKRAGADIFFISPVFATRSHPGARPLGRLTALQLKQYADRPVVALGGITSRDQRWLRAAGFYGWAAIDAWL